MEKQITVHSSYPHDAFFKAAFKIRILAQQLVCYALPPEEVELLDLDTLELAPESFIGEELQESLSDLVYICQYKKGMSLRICLLFEHKGQVPGREFHLQINRYTDGVAAEDIRQKRKDFTLCLPVVFYTGKKRWNPGTFRSKFRNHPERMRRYVRSGDLAFVSLASLNDDEIRALEAFFLLRSVFLLMKHAWEDDYFRKNFGEVFNFVAENELDEQQFELFKLMVVYLRKVSKIQKKEIMELTKALPHRPKTKFVSSWDESFMEGKAEGFAEALAIADEKQIATIKILLRKHPQLSDLEVSEMFGVAVARVRELRAAVSSEN